MSNNRLILASASARRKELLENLGVYPIVKPSNILEAPKEQEGPDEYATRNSQEKVLALWSTGGHLEVPTALAADTIVISPQGEIFEKPRNHQHAFEMLKELSGQWHTVITSFSIAVSGSLVHSQTVYTDVRFGVLEDDHINAYIKTGDPYDKSGSYGIQGLSAAFVSEIRGSYTNVMGLPMNQVLAALHQKTPVRAY